MTEEEFERLANATAVAATALKILAQTAEDACVSVQEMADKIEELRKKGLTAAFGDTDEDERSDDDESFPPLTPNPAGYDPNTKFPPLDPADFDPNTKF